MVAALLVIDVQKGFVMTRRPIVGLLVSLCAMVLVACGGGSASPEPSATASVPAAFSDRDADGEALAQAWFALLTETGSGSQSLGADPETVEAGVALVRPYLDPAFQLQRASGERYTAGTYVPLDVDAFEVSDVVVTRPEADVVVVRYGVSTPGATAVDTGMVMNGEVAPRLTVFRWDEALGHWVLVSHANFNTALAAVCDQEPIQVSGEDPETSAEDVALGESLVAQWRDITTGQSTAKVRHPEGQIQLADGQGWPNPDGSAIQWSPAQAYDFNNLAITRNGNLLVATYDAVASDLVVDGEEYRSQASPRMLTYLQNGQGTWELIGLANFTVPQAVPDGVDCVTAVP